MALLSAPCGCITGVAKTISDVLGISAPEKAGESLSAVKEGAAAAFGGKKADRVFIFNPDAIALWVYKKYADILKPVEQSAALALPLFSVMPSVTPVCFASMYTGALPEVHGIKSYTKPVLKTDTLFDAALRAGKKCAVVSTAGDSISMIFLEREMDYYIYETEEECNDKAAQLIEEDEHDLIVLYNGNFDSEMHHFSPESEQARAALKANAGAYLRMSGLIKEKWSGHKTLLGFCPDHGCHTIDGDMGSHGLDMPEDMEIIHFYDYIG